VIGNKMFLDTDSLADFSGATVPEHRATARLVIPERMFRLGRSIARAYR